MNVANLQTQKPNDLQRLHAITISKQKCKTIIYSTHFRLQGY